MVIASGLYPVRSAWLEPFLARSAHEQVGSESNMKLAAFLILFTVSTSAVASAQTHLQGGIAVRQSDSLLNGALIGAGAGVASVLFICRQMEPWRVCLDDVGTMAQFGALGAGIGMGIDALIARR